MTEPTHPILILGAARSGTKLLRDSLAAVLGCGRVPYDVGYVWRFDNESAPDDCLPASAATPRTRRLVHSFLGRYADDQGRLVEKTVGNTLRVGYVHALVPGARYVHIVRDGVDVAESARRQWTEAPDLRYLLGKARHFPIRLAPSYGVKFLADQTWRRRRHGGHAASWGPRYPGIDHDLATHSLLEVCGRQWRACVESAGNDLATVGAPVVEVRFEELAAGPAATLRRVVRSLGETVDEHAIAEASAAVHQTTLGRGRSHLSAEELSLLDAEIGDLLGELGYDRAR